MGLVQDPRRFDLLLSRTSTRRAERSGRGLVGGLAVWPGATYRGSVPRFFEAVHGLGRRHRRRNSPSARAADVGVMMLKPLAEIREDPACAETAQRIKEAYNQALAQGAEDALFGGTSARRVRPRRSFTHLV